MVYIVAIDVLRKLHRIKPKLLARVTSRDGGSAMAVGKELRAALHGQLLVQQALLRSRQVGSTL